MKKRQLRKEKKKKEAKGNIKIFHTIPWCVYIYVLLECESSSVIEKKEHWEEREAAATFHSCEEKIEETV